MILFVGVAATFFGALIDIFVILNVGSLMGFWMFFGAGIFSVALSFYLLGRYLQGLNEGRAIFISAGIGAANLVSWAMIFVFSYMPLSMIFEATMVNVTVVVFALFAIWHSRNATPDWAGSGRIEFGRRESCRARILGVLMIVFVVVAISLVPSDDPYLPRAPLSGALNYYGSASSPESGNATFVIAISNPANPRIEDIVIRVADLEYSLLDATAFSASWNHLASDQNHIRSGDRFTVSVPGVDISGHRIILTCANYAGTLEGEVPSARTAIAGGCQISGGAANPGCGPRTPPAR